MASVCNPPPVIGLIGPIGCGKTTAARHLSDKHGYTQMTMSICAKAMLYQLGLNEFDLEGPQAHRAMPHPLLGGKSPREAITTLATAWGREMVSKDLWVNAMQNRVLNFQTQATTEGRKFQGVVIDGIRFPNEAAMIRRLGGVIWRIDRPSAEKPLSPLDRAYHSDFTPKMIKPAVHALAGMIGKPTTHESEYHYRFMETEAVIPNASSAEELREHVTQLLTLAYCS